MFLSFPLPITVSGSYFLGTLLLPYRHPPPSLQQERVRAVLSALAGSSQLPNFVLRRLRRRLVLHFNRNQQRIFFMAVPSQPQSSLPLSCRFSVVFLSHSPSFSRCLGSCYVGRWKGGWKLHSDLDSFMWFIFGILVRWSQMRLDEIYSLIRHAPLQR